MSEVDVIYATYKAEQENDVLYRKYKIDKTNESYIFNTDTHEYRIKMTEGKPKRVSLICPKATPGKHLTRHLEVDVNFKAMERTVHTSCGDCGLRLATSVYDERSRPDPVADTFYFEELDKNFNWVLKNQEGIHE
jgi:hypothetical protein